MKRKRYTDEQIGFGLRQAACLNAARILSMADARRRIEQCGIAYNEHGPHTVLGNLTPREFFEQAHSARKVA